MSIASEQPLTHKTVMNRLGISSPYLHRLDDYCPYIEEGLDPVWDGTRKIYRPEVIGRVEQKRKEAAAGCFVNEKPVISKRGTVVPPGRAWQPLPKIIETLQPVWKTKNESIWTCLARRIRKFRELSTATRRRILCGV